MTLIGFIDRIRMLDNDLIRLRAKIDMILQEQERKQNEKVDSNSTSDNNSGSSSGSV
jgi:hypothetical protein